MIRRWCLPILLCLPILALAGAGAAPDQSLPVDLSLEGETLVLDNGMTFILLPRTGAPVFSGHIAFEVGSLDTVPGQTGVAHMFEHMVFKGTRHIGTTDWEKERPLLEALQKTGDRLTLLKATGEGTDEEIARLEAELARLNEAQHAYIVKDEVDRIYSEAGGRGFNASTGTDYTRYFVSLPSNELELWMLIESQRIREPVLREFFSERDVVFEERRMRNDNHPVGKLFEHFTATAFLAHPYRLSPIGWASDILALTQSGTEVFFHEYCAPSNAVGVLCGNFDTARAKSLIYKYFGSIPARDDPPPVVTKEPPQEAERRVSVVFEANPMMMVGFHKPAWPHEDDLSMDLIQVILTDGVTSRLYRRMVEGDGSVFVIQAINGVPGTRCDNLFAFLAVLSGSATYEEVEAALYEELDRLKSEPVSEAELEKAKTRILSGLIHQWARPDDAASLAATYQFITGDWRSMEDYLRDIQRVRPEDIIEAARTYFTRENRTVAHLVKPAEPEKEVGQ